MTVFPSSKQYVIILAFLTFNLFLRMNYLRLKKSLHTKKEHYMDVFLIVCLALQKAISLSIYKLS